MLGETLTFYGTGKSYVDCAEPIPGPSTKYFGELAKKHNLYIVAGLLERDRHLVYNVAVLLGPDGNIVGKYRKVCLPRGEIEKGVAPGHEYPVFQTRFGKVGMMVCYDGFFPEVARELTNRGAEVDRLAGLGLQPGPGLGPRLREPRLRRQQHLRGRVAKLDDLRRLRPRRQAARPGGELGHGGGRRGRSRQPPEVEQPRRLQGPPLSPSACAGAGAVAGLYSPPRLCHNLAPRITPARRPRRGASTLARETPHPHAASRVLRRARRLTDGGTSFLRYYSDCVLTAPVEEFLDPAFFPDPPGAGVFDLNQPAPRSESGVSLGRFTAERRGNPPAAGMAELQAAIAARSQRLGDRKVDPATEVLVTHGATGALATALDAFVNAGDRVVLFDPCSLLFSLAARSRRARSALGADLDRGWALPLSGPRIRDRDARRDHARPFRSRQPGGRGTRR